MRLTSHHFESNLGAGPNWSSIISRRSCSFTSSCSEATPKVKAHVCCHRNPKHLKQGSKEQRDTSRYYHLRSRLGSLQFAQLGFWASPERVRWQSRCVPPRVHSRGPPENQALLKTELLKELDKSLNNSASKCTMHLIERETKAVCRTDSGSDLYLTG